MTATKIRPARDPREEERQARQRERTLEKARREAARRREREARSTRAEIIREEKARRPDCRCPITVYSTPAQLRELGAGCTSGRWVCPCLDAIRRRTGR